MDECCSPILLIETPLCSLHDKAKLVSNLDEHEHTQRIGIIVVVVVEIIECINSHRFNIRAVLLSFS